jgi:hypothetical protein
MQFHRVFIIAIFITVGVIGGAPSVEGAPLIIMVQVQNPTSGGADYLPAKALAHGGSIGQSRQNNVLTSVVITDYTVNKDIKSVKAKFTICLGSSSAPIKGIYDLPIFPVASNPVKTSIGGNFTAYAQLVNNP